MDALDDIMNVVSIFSPTTALTQGEKAQPTFDKVDNWLDNGGGNGVLDVCKELPGGGLGVDIAKTGYSMAKWAAKDGQFMNPAKLFRGMFD